MELLKPTFRRTRRVRQMASWISTNTHLESHASPITVIKGGQPGENCVTEIAGLRQLSNKNTFPERIFWLIVILGATTLCIYQSAERIAHYISDPSIVHVQYIQNNTLKLPVIIFCPALPPSEEHNTLPALNKYLIKKRYGKATTASHVLNWFETGNISLSEVWHLSKLGIEKISLIKYENFEDLEKLQDQINVTEIYTPVGICDRVTFNAEFTRLTERPLFGLQLKMESGVYLVQRTVALTVPEESLIDTYFYHIKATSFFYEQSKKFGIQVSESIFRNTPKTPCTEEIVSSCLSVCLENIFIRNATIKLCRLPFLQHFNKIPRCSSKLELQEMLNYIHEATLKFSPEHCYCGKKCRQMLYTAASLQESHESLLKFEVSVLSGRITILKEEPAYSIYDVVSDFGGCLSLWLGVCFLEVLDVGTASISQILIKICSKKTAPKPNYVKGSRFRIVVIRQNRAKTVAPTIDLPGFRNVAKQKSSIWIRTTWLTISIIISLLCINQCVERIVLYFLDSSTINVYYKSDVSVPFPSIMICPNRSDGPIPTLSTRLILNKLGFPANYRHILHLISMGKLSVEEAWNMSGFSSKYVENITSSNKDWSSSIVPTVAGNCLNFQSKRSINYKRTPTSQMLHIYEQDEPGTLQITIYPNKDLALVKHLLGVEFVKRNTGVYDYYNMLTAFNIMQITYRNLKANPCLKREEVVRCLVNCFEGTVAQKVPQDYCRLPFMSTTTSACRTSKTINAVLNETINMITKFNYEDCMCHRACSEFLYNKKYFKSSQGTMFYSFVLLQIWNKEVMVLEEIREYSVFMLFSDLGAAIGLFSGICLMNLLEIVVFLIYKIFRFLSSRFGLKKTNKQTEPKSLHRHIHLLEGSVDNIAAYNNSAENSYSPLWIKIMWVLISAGLCCPNIYLILERIQFYASDPTVSTTYYFNNRTITFPHMIICTDVDHSVYGKSDDGITFLDYWSTSTFQPKEINVRIKKKQWTLKGNLNTTVIDEISLSLVETVAGMCLMLTPRKTIQYNGYKTKVFLNLIFRTSKSGWMAVFPQEKMPLVRYISPKDVYTANGVPISSATVSLHITEVVNRDTRKVICKNAHEVASCLADCIERKIYEKHGRNCRLPFMQESKTHHLCKTKEDYLKVKNATIVVLESFNQADCNCPRARGATIYSVSGITYYTRPLTMLRYTLQIPENSISVIKEEAAYSFSKLLMDLGGSLGLFFGLGLPQLLELLAASALQLKNSFFPH